MKTALLLTALVCQSIAVVLPRDVGNDADTDPVLTRTFALPGLPTGFPSYPPHYPPIKPSKRAPEPVAEPEALPGSDISFGEGPDPTKVQITGFTYGGTGCPAGSVGSAINGDRTIMTLIFDQYVASIGGGSAITERRKNCQLNLALKYPGGFQYSIMSADYRGYAYMDKGVSGTQKSTYYFSGQTAQASTGTTWKGPFDQNYLIRDTAASASVVWSPCGQDAMLNINSQVQLTSTNTNGVGYISTDSIDTSFVQQIYIQWQPCKA